MSLSPRTGAILLGDGVNIAARLERLAESGGIVISARVHEDAVGKLAIAAEDLGEQTLKNLPRPVRVFRVRPSEAGTPSPSLTASAAPPPALPDHPSLRSAA